MNWIKKIISSFKSIPKRGPIPMQAIGPKKIIAAMAQGGSIDGATAGSYLLNGLKISNTIKDSRLCLDFGCGTGEQLLQVAHLNPNIHFIGLDKEPLLLEVAKTKCQKLNIKNVEFRQADITNMENLKQVLRNEFEKVDAIISAMTLHGLNSVEELHSCFSNMTQFPQKNMSIYIEDFFLIKKPILIDLIIKQTALKPMDPHIEFMRVGLESAFTPQEISAAISMHLKNCQLFSTFPVRFLFVARTKTKGVTKDTQAKFKIIFKKLPMDQKIQFFLLKLSYLFRL